MQTTIDTPQHLVLEWAMDEGVRTLCAFVYKGKRNTGAYIPIKDEWPDGLPLEVWVKAQNVISEDDKNTF